MSKKNAFGAQGSHYEKKKIKYGIVKTREKLAVLELDWRLQCELTIS